ncbi:MAG: hypothetical protein U0R69_00660 [Gaiellales bacterium]
MAYQVTITFLVDADSEETLERYVDRLVYDVAERENFYLENRRIDEVSVPLPGAYRTITKADLPYIGR